MNDSNRHLRFGWWALAVYVCLGIGLEMMHGFKLGWYLDVGNEVRRLMFTLGHFHGTMLALVNIAAGLTIRNVEGLRLRPSVSWALIGAAILLPGGFLLGAFLLVAPGISLAQNYDFPQLTGRVVDEANILDTAATPDRSSVRV